MAAWGYAPHSVPLWSLQLGMQLGLCLGLHARCTSALGHTLAWLVPCPSTMIIAVAIYFGEKERD